MSKPKSVMFFPNGNTAVFDEQGQQMSEFQAFSCHKCTIEALRLAGYPLDTIPEVLGCPQQGHTSRCPALRKGKE